MRKTKKNLKKLTADEVIAHVFHPDAVKHLKEHVENLPDKKRKPLKEEE